MKLLEPILESSKQVWCQETWNLRWIAAPISILWGKEKSQFLVTAVDVILLTKILVVQAKVKCLRLTTNRRDPMDTITAL